MPPNWFVVYRLAKNRFSWFGHMTIGHNLVFSLLSQFLMAWGWNEIFSIYFVCIKTVDTGNGKEKGKNISQAYCQYQTYFNDIYNTHAQPRTPEKTAHHTPARIPVPLKA